MPLTSSYLLRLLCRELFEAYENEYTVFAPMKNCFEVFGLDFLVTQSYDPVLLEVNPGPDFKQTGDSLRRLVADLWENICQIVLDGYCPVDQTDFKDDLRQNFYLRKVYDKELSASKVQQNLKFTSS